MPEAAREVMRCVDFLPARQGCSSFGPIPSPLERYRCCEGAGEIRRGHSVLRANSWPQNTRRQAPNSRARRDVLAQPSGGALARGTLRSSGMNRPVLLIYSVYLGPNCCSIAVSSSPIRRAIMRANRGPVTKVRTKLDANMPPPT